MIKNIIFDIGNVLVTFHPQDYFLPHFKNAETCVRICNAVFQHSAWDYYDQGIYQIEDLKAIYKKCYPKEYADIAFILSHWLELMDLMEESYLYLKELKKQGYDIYLLSNISKDSADYLKKKMPFFAVVDGEIFSYAVKSNKPNPKIYEELLQKYKLQANESIFLDDNFKNVEQAQAMGFHAIQFFDVDNVKDKVTQIIKRESEND